MNNPLLPSPAVEEYRSCLPGQQRNTKRLKRESLFIMNRAHYLSCHSKVNYETPEIIAVGSKRPTHARVPTFCVANKSSRITENAVNR